MACYRPVSYTHLDVYKRQGSPLSSIIAEIFLQHIDTKIQNIIKTHDPDGIWIRYVDDGLYVSNKKNTNVDNILKQLNNTSKNTIHRRKRKT